MSKIVILTWPGGGNQPPAIGLAQRLRARGHEIVFAGYPDQVDRFAGLGFELVVMPGSSRGWDDFDPEDLTGFLVNQVWACPDQPADVSAVVEQESPDLVVVDCMLGAALAAVEDVGMPTATLVHSAPSVLCPPAGGVELNALNAVRARLGRDPLDTFWSAWEQHTVLCATIPELDPNAAEVPASFHWVGPIFEQTPAGAYALERDDRPLVLASFSSGEAWDQTSRIQRTLDGLAGSGVRLLMTTGAVDPAALHIPEDTATVLPYAPHGAVLPFAAAVVTHAGHGTLAAALAHGLPVVTLPNLGADQAALAAQVAHLGAGLHLDGDTASADDIRRAVEQVLTAPSYREVAERLADRMADCGAGLDAHLDQLLPG